MDACTLQEQIKHLAAAGNVTLNIDERLQIELALDVLQQSMCFEQTELWGKITGKFAQGLTFPLQVFKTTTSSLSALTSRDRRAALSAASSGALMSTTSSVSCPQLASP